MSKAMTAAQILLECLRTALESNPTPLPEDKIQLRAGEEFRAMLSSQTDECCTGIAWVRIVNIQPNPRFDAEFHCVGVGRLVTLEMGVMRCAPPVNDAALIPTAEQWLASALQIDADLDSMEQALCCLRDDQDWDAPPRLGGDGYVPIGPDGNCIGGRMQVELEVDCGCQA